MAGNERTGNLTAFSSLSIRGMNNGLKSMDAPNSLEAENGLLYSILDSIGNAIIITDIAGNVEMINRQTEEITGWSQEDANGKALKEILPLVSWTSHESFNEDIKRMSDVNAFFEFPEHAIIVDRYGNDRVINGNATPIPGEDSQIIGIILCLQDVTEKYKKEEIMKMQKFESLGILAGGIAHDFNNLIILKNVFKLLFISV